MMGFFKRKQKLQQNHKGQPKETRKKFLWLRRKDGNLQAASDAINATDNAREEDKYHSNEGKFFSVESPAEGSTKESAKAPEEKDVKSIWDRAYDSLKSKEKDLVTDYEELLSKGIRTDVTDGRSDEGKHRNVITQDDALERKSQMDEMMKAGQLRMKEKQDEVFTSRQGARLGR